MIRTAFWNTYGWALALNSRYGEAGDAAANVLADAEAYRLSFVEPHAQLLAALAAVGMRDLSTAHNLLEEVFGFAREREDLFLLANASAVLARLHIARGDCLKASIATADYHLANAPVRSGEYLGVRAVALAALGRTDEARVVIAAVPKAASPAEAQAFAELANVILTCNEDGDPGPTAHEAVSNVKALGQFDAFITACRAFPVLVDLAIRSGHGEFAADVLRRSNDADLAQRHGLKIPEVAERVSALSRREEQVLDLVAEGRTNEEVARVLFISPVTVKVHLRHIYEKLGVRNRVEAAARLTRERAPEPQ